MIACTDFAELRGLLVHRYPEASPQQGERRAETAQPRTDEDDIEGFHECNLTANMRPV